MFFLKFFNIQPAVTNKWRIDACEHTRNNEKQLSWYSNVSLNTRSEVFLNS